MLHQIRMMIGWISLSPEGTYGIAGYAVCIMRFHKDPELVQRAFDVRVVWSLNLTLS